ncbi:hypothetical protein SAMN05444722_0057 [Rhodovulum sp. ES.010]|uniref:hypothetical protein n=1 Tax=Rhodovulum sp. ES.010 TaxID=1882821 RepID=UPI000929A281|nr:hypothetical protein [Rhodovulum sp. ES.010]SIN99781.1 hypothetical protein SAMN05444722_0057 [Rhodovulum sp. ES.010]
MKTRYRNFLGAALVATLALGACAKQPDQIAAVEIDDHDYARLSCSQLADRKTRIEQDLTNLSAAQKAAASGDAWGVFLLGLPVSSMSGNDKEAAIAIAKGRLQAIERTMGAKRCR